MLCLDAPQATDGRYAFPAGVGARSGWSGSAAASNRRRMAAMSDTNAAAISIVIPSVNGWPDLDRCLGAVGAERAGTPLEALVPERCGPAVRDAAAKKYPWARILPVDTNTTIPQMR